MPPLSPTATPPGTPARQPLGQILGTQPKTSVPTGPRPPLSQILTPVKAIPTQRPSLDEIFSGKTIAAPTSPGAAPQKQSVNPGDYSNTVDWLTAVRNNGMPTMSVGGTINKFKDNVNKAGDNTATGFKNAASDITKNFKRLTTGENDQGIDENNANLLERTSNRAAAGTHIAGDVASMVFTPVIEGFKALLPESIKKNSAEAVDHAGAMVNKIPGATNLLNHVNDKWDSLSPDAKQYLASDLPNILAVLGADKAGPLNPEIPNLKATVTGLGGDIKAGAVAAKESVVGRNAALDEKGMADLKQNVANQAKGFDFSKATPESDPEFFTQRVPLDKIKDAQGMTLQELKDQAQVTKSGLDSFKAQGTEPEADAFHGAREGRQVTEPISAKINEDGSISVTDGNHRLRQALMNGDTDVPAIVKDSSGKAVLSPDVTKESIFNVSDQLEKVQPGLGDKFKSFAEDAKTNDEVLQKANQFIDENLGEKKGLVDIVQDKAKSFMKNRTGDAVDKLESDYERWSGQTKTGVKNLNKGEARTARLNGAGTEGRTPQRVLAEEGIIPQTKGTKFTTAEQADTFREETRPLMDVQKEALKQVEYGAPRTNLDDFEQAALDKARTSQNIASGKASKLEAQIKNEFADYRKEYGDTLSLRQVDEIKAARWADKKFDFTQPLKTDVNYSIAKAGQQIIQDTAEEQGYTEVAQLNREIGDRLEAAKYLETLDGQTLKGGKIGKYVYSAIGSSIGKTVPGKIVGALGGDLVADMLMRSDVATPVKRMILQNLEKTDPAAFKTAKAWLEKQGLIQETRLKLPAGAPLGSSKNPIITPNTQGTPNLGGKVPDANTPGDVGGMRQRKP